MCVIAGKIIGSIKYALIRSTVPVIKTVLACGVHNLLMWLTSDGECWSCCCFVPRILDSSCVFGIVGNIFEEVRCL